MLMCVGGNQELKSYLIESYPGRMDWREEGFKMSLPLHHGIRWNSSGSDIRCGA
jgi:hypothetical protein